MEVLYVEAAKAITKLVITHPLEQVKVAWTLKKQFEKLREEFTYIQAFLHDIERLNQRHREDSQLVNAWLRKVMDLAYLADNVMDDYSFQILHKRTSSWELKNHFKLSNYRPKRKLLSQIHLKNRQFKKKCSSFCSLSHSNPLTLRFRMSSKVNHILRSFDDLYKSSSKLGIRPAEMVTADVRGVGDREAFNSNINNCLDEVRELANAHKLEFVGREHDRKELTTLLSDPNNEEDISTIVVVGMGGLGKTTLARQLYENEAIIERFTERFWICISDSFTVKRVLCVMFEKITGVKCELSNTDVIIERVGQLVRGKRYLIVLDDVWDQSQSKWNSFKNSLRRLGGSTGSMILVTTRNKDIAKTAESRYMHQLTGLSDEESWAFFVQKAFPKGKATYDSELKEIGRRIVNKCKGLPLAINVIGGLLRMKEDLSEWKAVEKSKLWNLPQEKNDILPSLLLSFNNLSSPILKQCFAYCSIYPKEVLIDREDLINLWNAQGFLNSQTEGSSLTPEELGSKYFETMLSNSLLIAETRSSFDGDATEYRMHYLVHDMALYISRHEWLIWKGVDKTRNPSNAWHLAIYPNDSAIISAPPAESMTCLRTLHSNISLPVDLLVNAKNLRVLKLAAVGLKEVPQAVGGLHHLRYVDLSHNPIVMLPDSITSLYHLQTFRLFGYRLKELPQRLYRLVNLRHLHLTSDSWCLPRGIERLTALQTLPMLKLNEGSGWEIAEMGALNDIKGLLSISGLENVKNKGEAEKAGICKKTGISEMQLLWGCLRASNHLEVLDALQPPRKLELLMIIGYDGPNFPPWMTNMISFSEAGTPMPFYNLVHVELLFCASCRKLPALGQLPCLRDLTMHSMLSVTAIGDEFYHSSNVIERAPAAFPALRKLNISSFENLIEWAVPSNHLVGTVTSTATNAFPLLEILRIEQSDKLVKTPTNFPSLRHLQVDKSFRGQALYDVISESSKSLISLNINGVLELSRLPDELIDCRSLEDLALRRCFDLQSLPDGLGTQLTSLLHLSIVECLELREIPDSMGGCRSLKRLCIRDCPNLERIPNLNQLIHIEEVEVNGCKQLPCLPKGLQSLPRLNSLCIGGFRTLEIQSTSSVTSQLLFPALKVLKILNDDCVEEVPVWIGNLQSLQKMELKWCKNLVHLPSQDVLLRLTRLTALSIQYCPLLQERCVKNDGPEWDKISHIRLIRVNSRTIQEIPA
ncbi:unnamed protein product [Amaranthus hypochondriacus]